MARIIIAAKESPVRKAIRAMLIGQGHKIRCVEHGGAALQALADEDADLIIADAKMPVMDGVALALAAKDANEKRPVLLMAENPRLAETLSALKVFVDGVITKPFSVQALRREVVRLVPLDRSEAA